MKYIKTTLIGGTRDGEEIEVLRGKPMIYLTMRMSYDDWHALEIDDVLMWKPPEEVYELSSDGRHHYARTVHYKPDEQGETP